MRGGDGRGGGLGGGRRIFNSFMPVLLRTKDPRFPTWPGRSTSGFHRPGRHCPGGRGAGRGGFEDKKAFVSV